MNYSKSKFWFSLIGAILLIAVIIGGGYMAYRAGFNQGAISEIAGDVEWTFEDAPFFHPYKHMGRSPSFGGIFFGILFFFLVIGLIKRLFFIPPWGYARHMPPGMKYGSRAWKRHYWGNWDEDEDEEAEGLSGKDDKKKPD